MKHYLTFLDDTSDKFWQIETSGTSFTVTYGRNGTSGQSQTKTFDSEEKCLKEAEKVLAEKRKKGYSEDGVVSELVSNPKSTKAKTEKEDNLQAVLEEYDQIIQSEEVEDLLPFLQKLEKRHYEPFRKHIRKAKRYWMDYVELIPKNPKKQNDWGTWGYRGNENQKSVIVLSAIAVYDKTDINSWDEPIQQINQITVNEDVRDILLWAKPNWLNTYLLNKKLKNDWTHISYVSLLKLEELALITYEPQLYALVLASYNGYDSLTQKNQDATLYIDKICTNPQSYQRDILALFDYESNIQNCTGLDDKNNTYNVPIWTVIFNRLIEENKLDKQWFLENCLQIQTKEWNNGLKSFFRKRFEDINPSKPELITIQQTFLPLLHASYNSVANFSVSSLKDIYQEEGFKTDEFLDWISPVMMREDCKGSIKTLLTMFEKMMKTNSDSREKILDLMADVFVVNDLSIQEKAAKLILTFGKQSDDSLKEKLSMYAPQMLGNGKITLKDFLESDEINDETEQNGQYTFQIKNFSHLPDKNKVKLPQTWHEFLFQIGKFITSGKTINTEILMNSLITMRSEFPDDFQQQCDPYLQQLQKTYYESAHHNLTKDFLINFLYQNKKPFNPDGWYLNGASKTVLLQKDRLKHLERKLAKKSSLPMLSMPTHEPYYVEPKTLIERLIDYQEANEAIDMTDFAIAIARMPRDRVEEALPLYDKLDDKVAKLMRYCLGKSDVIELEKDAQSFVSRILFTNTQSIKFSDFNSLWVVAARTYFPDKVFTEFEGSIYDDVPNVSCPFEAKPYIEENKNEYKHWQTGKMEVSYWYDLKTDFPPHKTIPDTLLYSLDLFNRGKNHYYSVQKYDIFFWTGFIPQNTQAVYSYILGNCLGTSDGVQNALEAGLRLMLVNYFRFTDSSSYVLAVACLVQKREYRGLAVEVLLYHFERQSIEPTQLGEKIAYLIQNKYAGIQRFVEVVNLVKDASNIHNQGLIMMIDAIIGALKSLTDLPMNTKKLLEVYFDLLTKTNRKPSPSVVEAVENWQKNATLKSITKQILSV